MTDKEKQWDTVAGDCQRVAGLGMNEYNNALLRFWREKGMLFPGARVIDIGCGVGKYGVYLAELGCDVTLTDISGEMLRHARENMARFSTPWTVYQCDFDRISGQESVFKEGFDLSLSTMSPAIHDAATVRKMSAMTHGWCFLARFASWEQPARDEFLARLGIAAEPATRRMRDDCENMLAAVKAAGFVPQHEYVDYNWLDTRSPEAFAEYMLRRHPRLESVSRQRTVDCAQALARCGEIADEVFTKVMWIYWRSEGKG